MKELQPFENPKSDGNSPKHHTGKPCIEHGCNEPAGTAWGKLWCQKHNAERLNRVSKGFENIEKEFQRLANK